MDLNQEKSEVSFLDLLLVVAENLKLLIVVPILVGLMALALSYTLPQSFISLAIISMPVQAQAPTQTQTPTQAATQAAVMFVSPLILDQVISALHLADSANSERVRNLLISQIRTVVGKDGLLRVEVTAPNPGQAQAISSAIIEAWLKSSKPGGQDRIELEKRLAYAEASLASANRVMAELGKVGRTVKSGLVASGDAAIAFAALSELQTRDQASVVNISRALQRLSQDIVVQPPTLPINAVAPKRSVIATMAAIGCAFALLIWVFMQFAWVTMAKDPFVARTQARLRGALGLKISR
jgi:LPS O-antigen subunit length determinant protein (WzzB/FepE family)